MANIAELAVGQEIGSLVRRTGVGNWVRYSAVNDEFVPIHMDEAAGREAGFNGPIGMGNLQWSYYHNILRGWLNGAGRIEQMNVKFQNPNLNNTVVTLTATVSAIEPGSDGATRVTVALVAEDNDARRLSTGEAVVSVSGKA